MEFNSEGGDENFREVATVSTLYVDSQILYQYNSFNQIKLGDQRFYVAQMHAARGLVIRGTYGNGNHRSRSLFPNKFGSSM